MTDYRYHHAFSLVETIICTVLVGTMLVAALSTVSAARLGQHYNALSSQGLALAQSFLAEIESLDYQDPDGLGTFGLESDESTTVRTTWDDVDDYHELKLTPVTDMNGIAIPEYSNWTISTTVNYANPADPTENAVSDTGLKRITLAAIFQNRTRATLTALKASVEP